MRTTLDIDKPILDGLKRLQRKEKTTMGKLVSRLLAEAMHQQPERTNDTQSENLNWLTANMQANVNLADKEAVYQKLDADR